MVSYSTDNNPVLHTLYIPLCNVCTVQVLACVCIVQVLIRFMYCTGSYKVYVCTVQVLIRCTYVLYRSLYGVQTHIALDQF